MTVAKATVQSHGYNALNFREIAKEVGVTSASIHYYFPTKGDLGMALASQYADEADQLLSGLSLDPKDSEATVDAYLSAFRSALLNDNRMCLCGIMLAERDDLPIEVKREVDRFTVVNVSWLEKLVARLVPELAASDVAERALAIFSAIEGAQLVARGSADIAVFDRTISAYRKAGLLP
ncbi:TetR/AcrR family transcriptional regulator [Rhizobium sp. BK376]|uniref:TetR/AcrR family transcriptional regulator n=1 Tax=Rhizobium sp. BK376 TaxID=2512149 RepID=UPI001051D312|nr:TetR/AcrR family transcriptional regulator [Rhizobium sp. BK376]